MYTTNKTCTNPNCVDFNKYVLPSEANFCPKCGQQIEHYAPWDALALALLHEDDIPRCPNCHFSGISEEDYFDADGALFVQYTCHGCHYVWRHDVRVRCPSCNSTDIEDDGSPCLQYSCHSCGEVW